MFSMLRLRKLRTNCLRINSNCEISWQQKMVISILLHTMHNKGFFWSHEPILLGANHWAAPYLALPTRLVMFLKERPLRLKPAERFLCNWSEQGSRLNGTLFQAYLSFNIKGLEHENEICCMLYAVGRDRTFKKSLKIFKTVSWCLDFNF